MASLCFTDECFILRFMKKKPPIVSKDDRDLFRDAVGDVHPLEDNGKVRVEKQKPSPRVRQHERQEQQSPQDTLSDPIDLADVAMGEELLFCRSGVQPSVMKKLRRGQFVIEDELDLHRKTADEARLATATFLQAAHQNGMHCIRIIHGKGLGSPNQLPVLKTKVNHWLKQCDEVLAFCSARQVDGGTGAVYVLLRNQRSAARK